MIAHVNRVPGVGKANRKLITPEGGAAPFYAAVTFADDPVDAGALITKLMLDEFLAASGPTGGSASALTLAQAGFVLADGAPVRFKLHTAIVGAVTLAVGGTAAKPLTYLSGDANLAPAPAGSWLSATYSSTLDSYVMPSDPTAINVTVADIPTPLKATLTPLAEAKYDMAMAADAIGNVYVAGGNMGGSLSAMVEKYDINDTKTTLTALSYNRVQFSGAGNGDGNVLFAGGYDGNGLSSLVTKYDSAGVRTAFGDLSFGRQQVKGARLGNGHSIFVGGSGNGYYYGNVEKFDTAGVRTVLENLSQGYIKSGVGVDGNGNVIVAGGTWDDMTSVNYVDKYLPSGSKTTLTALSTARYSLASAVDGNGSVIFAGGRTSSSTSSQSAVVEKYDKTGTKTTLTSLSQARYGLVGARITDGSVIFAGGLWSAANTPSSIIERYDLSGIRTTITPTDIKPMLAVTNGAGSAVILGDADSNYQSAMIKIYMGHATKSVNIPMYALYKFQEHGTELRAMSNPTNVTINTPNTGTIRFGGALAL